MEVYCYKPQASSTYAANGDPFWAQYGGDYGTDRGYINGSLGTDVVDFGGDLVDMNQTFGIASTVCGAFDETPDDLAGVFGLGWPSPTNDKVQSPVFQILNQLDKPLYTVWLDR